MCASIQPSQVGLSLVLNWLVGPALMTGLAWAALPDLPGYRNGVILVRALLPFSQSLSAFRLCHVLLFAN